MRRLIATLALTGALGTGLGGCEYNYYERGPSPPPPAPPLPRRPPVDACGASSLQYLIGRSVEAIPQGYGRREPRVVGRRSYYEDRFDPDRLTIVYDEDSGRITRVRCG